MHLNVFRNCSNFRKVYARLELKMTKLNHSPTGVLQQQQQQQYYRIWALNLRRHVSFRSKYTIQGPRTRDSYDEETCQNFNWHCQKFSFRISYIKNFVAFKLYTLLCSWSLNNAIRVYGVTFRKCNFYRLVLLDSPAELSFSKSLEGKLTWFQALVNNGLDKHNSV